MAVYINMKDEAAKAPIINPPTSLQENTVKILPVDARATQAITSTDASLSIYNNPNQNIKRNPQARRMRRTTYQARLGRKLDNISRKILDNNIRLSAHPTDMLRIRANRDERSHDLISRTIESVEVLPIILPKMVDIPLRHFLREGSDILIPSLYPIQQSEYFELYAPIEVDLNEDDLLIRILYDSSPEIHDPYVMVLQCKEILGSFNYSSLLWKKVLATFYDEKLPVKVVNIVKQEIAKREKLDW